MKTIFETERLIIRKVNVDDAQFIFEMYNSSSFLKYIGDRHLDTLEKAKNYILENFLPNFEKYGFGNYVCIEKKTQNTIGSVGLFKRENLDIPDIGFSFLDKYHGKGFAYEASSELLKLAKTEGQFKNISAITSETNLSSRKLIEKLGLKYQKMIYLANDPEELLYYEAEL